MRLKQLLGVLALSVVGLVGCGEVDDPGRTAIPVQVVVVSPTWSTVIVDVDYEVFGELAFTTSSGSLLTGATVRDGETLEVANQLFVTAGDEVLFDIAFTIDGAPFAPATALVKVEADTTGVEIRLTHREDLGAWVLRVEPLAGIDGPGDGTDEAPGDGTGEGPGDGTGEGPDDGTGEAPDDGTGEGPDDGTGEGPDDGTGEAPDDGTGEGPGDGTGEGPGDGNAFQDRVTPESVSLRGSYRSQRSGLRRCPGRAKSTW